jgi:hypothetical protein
MRAFVRAGALALLAVLLGAGECTAPQVCEARGAGTCYYADDLPGRGGRGTFDDPFRLGDFPASASDCDDRGALPPSLRPGDVFYFRGGLYPLDLCANPNDGSWYKPAIDAQGDGTRAHPIVFRSYPGERATLRRRSGIAPLAGSYDDDHVRFVGLTIEYPRVSPADDAIGSGGRSAFVILGGDHVGVAYNSISLFDHPKQSGNTDNHDAIFLSDADFPYIGHNRIVGAGNAGNPVPSINCTGLKSYRSRFMVVEDNWFASASTPIFDKEEGVDNTYRRNLTSGSSYASFAANGNDLPRWGRARIHDNVFDSGILATFLADGYEVFRNDVRSSSLFNAFGAVNTRRVYRSAVYDNIVRVDGDASVFTGNPSGQRWEDRHQVFSYMDHNCYVGSNVRPLYRFGGASGLDVRTLSSMRGAGFELDSRAVASQGACGPGRSGGALGPVGLERLVDLSRYGAGNESQTACGDGIDQDGDALVDYPADPDCRSREGSSEGSGTTNLAPQIVSIGGPYVSRNGEPVVLDVVVSDPDSVERISWRVENSGRCRWNVQYFLPTQLVEDPRVMGLPAADGECRVRLSVYDGLGRVVDRSVPITLIAD